jgi:hypothetical protein
MKEKRNSKLALEWAIFCKDNYNADAEDVSDAYELANNIEMRDKLRSKRIKYLQSITIPTYSTK